MIPAVRSSLDVAIWFCERAESANRAMPAIKLQQLLYLAQVEYAKKSGGRKLLPATFLAAPFGPLEPTVYHACERGKPALPVTYPARQIEEFLMKIWDGYATQPAELLDEIVRAEPNYRRTLRQGHNSEIDISPIHLVEDTADSSEPARPKKRPQVRDETFVGISSSGKRATKWRPGSTLPKF